jgi:hypothetical protein
MTKLFTQPNIILFYFWKYNDIKFDCCKFHWGEVECKKCKICKRLRKKHKESKTIEKIEMKELSPYPRRHRKSYRAT